MHSANIVIQTVTRMFVNTEVWSRIRGSIHIVVLNSVFWNQRSSSSPINVLFLSHSHSLRHHLNKRRTQKNITRKWISSQRKMPQIQRNLIKELFRYARENRDIVLDDRAIPLMPLLSGHYQHQASLRLQGPCCYPVPSRRN